MKKIIFLQVFIMFSLAGFGQSIPFNIKIDRLSFFYPDSGERIYINAGDSISLVSFDKISTWKAIYKGVKGSIIEAYLIDNKEYRKKFVPEIKPETHEEKKTRLIKNYGVVAANDILNKTIRLGINRFVLTEILGKPDDVNRTVGSFGTHEQWVYKTTGGKMEFYYFENGILTSWQD